MKLTEQETQRRKQRIMDTAFRLFCEKGIENVSLTDVAEQAEVGASTIYRYFTNKPSLVLATMSVLWKSIVSQLEGYTGEGEAFSQLTGYEQLAIRLESFRRLYLDNGDYVLFSYEAKLYLQRNGIELSRGEYDVLMEELRAPCMATLEKGKADGSICTQADSEDLFYAIWGAVRGYIVKIVIYKALCQDHGPWESRYGLLVDLVLSALRPCQ